MELFETKLLPLAGLLSATGLWLGLAAYNNIRDKGTNLFLLGLMFRMDLIVDEEPLGRGLKQRAIHNEDFVRWVLRIVITAQLAIAALFLCAGYAYLSTALGMPFPSAKAQANCAVSLFSTLWFFFMIGGLWFGYWIKQSTISQVHISLQAFSVLLLIAVNLPS